MGPEGETDKGEAEGVEIGGLRGVGVGIDGSLHRVGVGGAKGLQGAEDGGVRGFSVTQRDPVGVLLGLRVLQRLLQLLRLL